jgi:hypothetical protein
MTMTLRSAEKGFRKQLENISKMMIEFLVRNKNKFSPLFDFQYTQYNNDDAETPTYITPRPERIDQNHIY